MNGFDPTAIDTSMIDPSVLPAVDSSPTDAILSSGQDISSTDTGFNVPSDVIGSNAGGFPVSTLLGAGASALTSAFGGGQAMPVATRLFPRPMVPMLPSIVGKGIMNQFGKFTAFGRAILAFLKKFGPGAGVALGLSAAEIANLLLHSTRHKRRRMNPCNTKALGRATRRLISFERRASRISAALSCIVHRAPRRRARGHCFKCKRNPCVCG